MDARSPLPLMIPVKAKFPRAATSTLEALAIAVFIVLLLTSDQFAPVSFDR